MTDLVKRLREESARLSGYSLDRASAEAGVNANLADEAASALEALRGEVVVKPLEWDNRGVGVHYARTAFGTYKATPSAWWFEDGPTNGDGRGSLAEAKAAAQADYETRIRSALIAAPPVSASPTPDKMMEALKKARRRIKECIEGPMKREGQSRYNIDHVLKHDPLLSEIERALASPSVDKQVDRPTLSGEPVAWRYRWKLDGEWTNWRVADASQKSRHLKDLEEIPLFTAPVSPAPSDCRITDKDDPSPMKFNVSPTARQQGLPLPESDVPDRSEEYSEPR